MKAAHVSALAIVLALAAGGCSRQGERLATTTGPPEGPRDPLRIAEAHWVRGAELSQAVSLASRHRLVAAAVGATTDPRLHLAPQFAIRAVGATEGGLRCAVTLLPFGRDDDSTCATFVALMDRDATTLAQSFDLIAGRDPTMLEPGFSAMVLAGGVVAWIREREALAMEVGGMPRPAPERFKLTRWATCFFALAPAWCEAGARIAREAAPGVPWAAAAGCGGGVAVAAVACVAGAKE